MLCVTLPAAVIWYEKRPLRADSPGELYIQLFMNERNHIEAELGQRNSYFVTPEQTAERWNALKQSMLAQGATKDETAKIIPSLEDLRAGNVEESTPNWPVLIKRGYVRGTPVWVQVVAERADKNENVRVVTGWEYHVRVIDIRSIQGIAPAYHVSVSFPRCEGPNSPYPEET